MKIHFTAIGGSVMHNLAVALKLKGYQVSGSDDEIYEPSRSRLAAYGILPPQEGWFPEKITPDLDAVILGMHARKDNPELLRAQQLGIKVYSYPEYVYQQSRHKERVVIAGSHGKTTTTAMVMHVLNFHNKKFDYMVGAMVPGFESTVRLTEDAPVIIIEGDEYLSSPIDLVPKFLHYKHHIGLITGIAWDHINVYPVFDDYVRQFEQFAVQTPKAGTLIYCEEDDLATIVSTSNQMRSDVNLIAYGTHKHEICDGKTLLHTPHHGKVPVAVFGKHNMQNISGAKIICNRLGISDKKFYEAIQSFKGAAKRMELLGQNAHTTVYRDFAHAPSKIEATIRALKEQFPHRKLVACAELHTYSSLSKHFLPQYKHTMQAADEAIVCYSPKTLEIKRMEPIDELTIQECFDHPNLRVFTNGSDLCRYLLAQQWQNKNLLLMSSGTFDQIDLAQLTANVLEK
ncbi:MAG: Mur ligase family protein [Cytophagales bacterium]|nr:Mur ligase family protein [Bernardetiaceae bacterium]MDW8204183.1 Mur ligase family protein [Cytophagales bacterium]